MTATVAAAAAHASYQLASFDDRAGWVRQVAGILDARKVGKPSKELPPGTERSILKQAGISRRAQ